MMRCFSVLIKPASSLCNLRCKYCFYHNISSLREVESYGIMTADTMHCLIEKAISYAGENCEISFAFQGGEPTLAGIGFFREFAEYANSKKMNSQRIHFSLQTNGTLIDESFCDLLEQHHFLVGLSLDAFEENHNYFRPDSNQNNTYKKVLSTLKLFDQYQIDYNILTVVTKQIASKPIKTMNFYKKNKMKFIQLIPCLEPLDSSNSSSFTLTPELYGNFLKQIFEVWYTEILNNNYISIRYFDNIITLLRGFYPEQCGMLGHCSPQCVIEANGDVYPCDFYVLDQYNCGNINQLEFPDVIGSGIMKGFIEDANPLPSICYQCKFLKLCNGGCKRYRQFVFSKEDYCPFQDFLTDKESKLNHIVSLIH